jgi:hypothetical protein
VDNTINLIARNARLDDLASLIQNLPAKLQDGKIKSMGEGKKHRKTDPADLAHFFLLLR